MPSDLTLTIFHHLAAFGIMAVLAMQWTHLRGEATLLAVKKLTRLNVIYWIMVVVVLAAGLMRAIYGDKGWEFYQRNPAFHAKLGIFFLIGVMAILPTMRVMRWRRASAIAGWQVPLNQWRGVRICVALEFHLYLFMPVLATLAARGVGMK